MDEFESLSHAKWEYKYHVVFIPKGRRKALYGHLRQHLGGVFRQPALQKESRIEEASRDEHNTFLRISAKRQLRVSGKHKQDNRR
jgi:putative transposase